LHSTDTIVTTIPIVPPDGQEDVIAQLYAPLQHYVPGVISLMIRHAWDLHRQKHIPVKEALMDCAWIGRLITLDKRVQDRESRVHIEGWSQLEDAIIARLESCKNKQELDSAVGYCMQLISPVTEKRFQHDYRMPLRKFHCWWYTIHEDETLLAVHLVNAYQPESPFAHLHHFAQTLLMTIEDALASYPRISRISCGSWLNQTTRFRQMWPLSFQQNVRVLNETGGFGPGVWGQYMTTEGGFHTSKAASLLASGKHPFALTEAESPLEEMFPHITHIAEQTRQGS
jgi:hypothetical protein